MFFIIGSSKPNFEFRNLDEHILADRVKNPHRNVARIILKIIDYEDKILEKTSIIKTLVVRNGRQSTLGYHPEVWKGWN